MKIKPPYNVNEKFFLIFNGEKLSLTSKTKVKQTVMVDDEPVEVEIPMSYDGYLLDMDEDFYYLGNSASEVSLAVLKSEIVAIEIEQVKNVMDEILDDMGDPEDYDIN